MALRDQLVRYEALLSDVRMSDYGYWVVTYNVAPGVSMSVMVCDTALDRDGILQSAQTALMLVTGQTVRHM